MAVNDSKYYTSGNMITYYKEDIGPVHGNHTTTDTCLDYHKMNLNFTTLEGGDIYSIEHTANTSTVIFRFNNNKSETINLNDIFKFGCGINIENGIISSNIDNNSIKCNSNGNLYVNAGCGLDIGTNGLFVRIKGVICDSDTHIGIDKGLEFTNENYIKIKNGCGINFDDNGSLIINYDTDTLECVNGKLKVKNSGGNYTSGCGIDIDSNNNILVKFNGGDFICDTNGLKLKNNINILSSDSIKITTSTSTTNDVTTISYKPEIKLKTISGLAIQSGTNGGLYINLPNNSGLLLSQSGLSVNVDNSTIKLNSNGQLQATSNGNTYASGCGINIDGNNNISVKFNDLGSGLQCNTTDGLKVKTGCGIAIMNVPYEILNNGVPVEFNNAYNIFNLMISPYNNTDAYYTVYEIAKFMFEILSEFCGNDTDIKKYLESNITGLSDSFSYSNLVNIFPNYDCSKTICDDFISQFITNYNNDYSVLFNFTEPNALFRLFVYLEWEKNNALNLNVCGISCTEDGYGKINTDNETIVLNHTNDNEICKDCTISVKYDTSSGIIVNDNGLAINIDGNTITCTNGILSCSGSTSSLSSGCGIDINNNIISVYYNQNKGLSCNSTTNKLEVSLDNTQDYIIFNNNSISFNKYIAGNGINIDNTTHTISLSSNVGVDIGCGLKYNTDDKLTLNVDSDYFTFLNVDDNCFLTIKPSIISNVVSVKTDTKTIDISNIDTTGKVAESNIVVNTVNQGLFNVYLINIKTTSTNIITNGTEVIISSPTITIGNTIYYAINIDSVVEMYYEPKGYDTNNNYNFANCANIGLFLHEIRNINNVIYLVFRRLDNNVFSSDEIYNVLVKVFNKKDVGSYSPIVISNNNNYNS